ncbi:MAG: lysoplasmalogenase [Deltaproteobacteria bacterium]|nr:lysoplasmalogenase [Deltaproteobacteria bacterium]
MPAGLSLNLVIILAALCCLYGLVRAEKNPRPLEVLNFKVPCSLLFVALALAQAWPQPLYARLVLAGLGLGLLGDTALALPGRPYFLAGLAAFLLGHLAYVAAFGCLIAPAVWSSPGLWLGLVPLALAGAAVFWWLRPRLGPMKKPVAAYVVVISLMVLAAWGAFQSGLPPVGRVVVLVGAVLFYLSDLAVARDRFVAPGWPNRAVGLPLYYAAQFLLAWSVGLVG